MIRTTILSLSRYILISCIFLVACSQTKTINKVARFNDARQIKISLEHVNTPSKIQQKKLNKASKLINNFLNSSSFKTLMLAGPLKLNYIKLNESQTNACNQKGRATFTYNTVKGRCFNNKEIYEVIKSAEWKLKIKIRNSWKPFECNFTFNNSLGSLIGDIIITPKCKFNIMSAELLAGFLMHEYMHMIGFDHPYPLSPNRKNTIPYFIQSDFI